MRELTMREYKKLVKEYDKDLADEIVERRDNGAPLQYPSEEDRDESMRELRHELKLIRQLADNLEVFTNNVDTIIAQYKDKYCMLY